MVLAALAIEYLLCNVWLKNAVAAARPCDLNQSVQLLIAGPGTIRSLPVIRGPPLRR